MTMTGSETTTRPRSNGSSDTPHEQLVSVLPPLPVMIGSAVTIIHYGTDCPLNGRLLGHFLALERGAPESNIFYGNDLVYIENLQGRRELGNLYSPMWSHSTNPMDFNFNNTVPLSEGCALHGQECVIGQYMVNGAQRQ